jgi:hypothetical protein
MEKSWDLVQLKLPLSIIMGLQIVFSRTISRGYHLIKNTHIFGLKHKFITSNVDSNKNKEMSYQVGMNNRATGEEIIIAKYSFYQNKYNSLKLIDFTTEFCSPK